MSDENVDCEIWGLPDDNGGYSEATVLMPYDSVRQLRLQSLGFIFWRFASFTSEDYQVFLENSSKL